MAKARNLRELVLAGSSFADRDIPALARLLAKLPRLRVLSLQRSSGIGPLSERRWLAKLPAVALVEVRLWGCDDMLAMSAGAHSSLEQAFVRAGVEKVTL